MTDEQLYCDGPGEDGNPCGRPNAKHGAGGKCEPHLKQLQRTGKMVPIVRKISAEERVINAADHLVQVDPLDDVAYTKAREAVLAAARALGATARRNAIRKGLERAARRGTRIGRPPKVTAAEVRKLLRQLKSPAAVARKLGVDRKTVYNRLGKK